MARLELSPLTRWPEARLGAHRFERTNDDVRETVFDQLERVRTLRDFLAAPEAFLRHL